MVLCHSSEAENILKTKCQKALCRNKAFCQSWEQVANSSVGTASDWKAWSNTDSGSNPRCSKGFFLPNPLWRQTLLRCSYSPRVQSHASTSVCALTLSLPLWHHIKSLMTCLPVRRHRTTCWTSSFSCTLKRTKAEQNERLGMAESLCDTLLWKETASAAQILWQRKG